MSEDIVYDCFHSEIVNYCLGNNNNKENDFSTLEYIGFTTGYRLIERLTRDLVRFKDELETMKFICTDFWTLVYKKQVDNLRTNNHGVYVVQDKAFRFLTRISPGSKQLEHAPKPKYLLQHVQGQLNWNLAGYVAALRYSCKDKPTVCPCKNNEFPTHYPHFVAFTCGLLRGALSNLGINSTVTAEVQSIPACKFHIEVNRN